MKKIKRIIFLIILIFLIPNFAYAQVIHSIECEYEDVSKSGDKIKMKFDFDLERITRYDSIPFSLVSLSITDKQGNNKIENNTISLASYNDSDDSYYYSSCPNYAGIKDENSNSPKVYFTNNNGNHRFKLKTASREIAVHYIKIGSAASSGNSLNCEYVNKNSQKISVTFSVEGDGSLQPYSFPSYQYNSNLRVYFDHENITIDDIQALQKKACPESMSLNLIENKGYTFVHFSSFVNESWTNNDSIFVRSTEVSDEMLGLIRENICVSNNQTSCESNPNYSCVWVAGKNGNPGYCNINNLQYVMCGGAFDIPAEAPRILSFVINLLKIGTPIILIILGLITIVKAIAASKEDEIKKAQSSLIKKIIAAVLVFLVTSIVQFVILKVAEDSEAGDISSCLSCFLNNDCDTNEYFKYEKSGKTYCHYVNNPAESFKCPDNVD